MTLVFRSCRFVVFACSLLTATDSWAQPRILKPAPSPADNPLKGLVPYARPAPGRFPHSMEFQYLPLSDLVTGPDTFDWQPLEDLLDDIASRRHQTVFRVWMEYPGRKEGIPKFLEREGLKVTEWLCTNTDPFPRQMVRTPDYDDPQLHNALRRFILAMGEKYDGDPRIGFITAGLLGTWGEWHSYPREDLYPTKEVQQVVMDAYQTAFPTTPVLLRYPAGDDNYHYAPNHERPFGYHDDSFAWATLDTGRSEDDWFFMPALAEAGALDKWKSQPIGGEIRPELWQTMFTAGQKPEQGQDFAACVRQTHATWLMDTGMFEKRSSQQRRQRAIEEVRKMGYDFQIVSADIRRSTDGNEIAVNLTLRNNGVAPFYYDWKVELAAFNETGDIAIRWPTDWSVTRLLPGDEDRKWSTTIDVTKLSGGPHQLAVRVINPLPGGLPLRFANADQDRHIAGWLSLGSPPNVRAASN